MKNYYFTTNLWDSFDFESADENEYFKYDDDAIAWAIETTENIIRDNTDYAECVDECTRFIDALTNADYTRTDITDTTVKIYVIMS